MLLQEDQFDFGEHFFVDYKDDFFGPDVSPVMTDSERPDLDSFVSPATSFDKHFSAPVVCGNFF